MKLNTLGRLRTDKGFSLVTIITFGAFAMMLLFALLPMIERVLQNEGNLRNVSELRTAAEIGIDYGTKQLNDYAMSNPGQALSPTVVVPPEYLTGFPNGSVKIRIRPITHSDWNNIKYYSAIYSPSLDPQNPAYSQTEKTQVNQDYWRVIESTAKRGLLSRSVRVFLEPAFNLPAKEGGGGGGGTTNVSYFKNAFFARETLTVNPTSTVTVSGSSSGNLDAYANESVNLNSNTILQGAIKTNNQDNNSNQIDQNSQHGAEDNFQPEVIPAPVPSADNARPLPQDVTTLPAGSYTTTSLDSSIYNVNIQSPVQIYIQDGSAASNSIAIQTSIFKSNPSGSESSLSGAQNLQIWYSGKRPVSINLDSATPFKALVYSPNAEITLTGSGNFVGALVGKKLTISSSGTVNIDTNLQDSSNQAVGTNGLTYATKSGAIVLHGYKAVTWKEFAGSLVP